MEQARLHDLRDTDTIPSALLARTEADLSAFTDQVKPIVEAVRTEGDRALQRLARSLDGVTAAHMTIRVEAAEFDAALRALPREVIQALEHAIDNIRRFHSAQSPPQLWLKEIEPGHFVATHRISSAY